MPSSKDRNTMRDKQNEDIRELDSEDGVKRKYRNFKKFDIVQDHSDHHYSTPKSSGWQPTKEWAKKIQEEWKILKRGLPDMIFVRVYEGRMDLLRAVIIGVEGTPYCDGLFFFDVCFPQNYPNDPPQVHYHSGGLRINPNLYHDGKVCLSLLNTWYGAKNEKWTPAVSTMLQVLVSIQGIILNAKPYYNEPLVLFRIESYSLQYSQQTLVHSLKTMVYSMHKPPKHFEDLVIGHFRDRASGILTACEAYYTEGKGVKYGVNVRKESGLELRKDVERYMRTLVGAFKQIGVEDDLKDFVPRTENLTQLTEKKSLIQRIIDFFKV